MEGGRLARIGERIYNILSPARISTSTRPMVNLGVPVVTFAINFKLRYSMPPSSSLCSSVKFKNWEFLPRVGV